MRAFAIACLGVCCTVFAGETCPSKCTLTEKLSFPNCEKVSVTSPAGPAVACGAELGIYADFLYWTVHQGVFLKEDSSLFGAMSP